MVLNIGSRSARRYRARAGDKSGETSEIECAGVFPFIGVEPNTGFLPNSMLDKSGEGPRYDHRTPVTITPAK